MSQSSGTRNDSSSLTTSVPSSPPEFPKSMDLVTDQETIMMEEEENKAQVANNIAEERRKKLTLRKRKKVQDTKEERDQKALQLEALLNKSERFSQVLTKKTEVLGRVGSGFDGNTLGEHDLVMAKQPSIMVGGTMRSYQLEGLTWMYEICLQGMSGILADEMGLGKTIQTIALIALLREKEDYLGPHLIVAPLSTLSNWMDEFEKWTPSIPVLKYHGTPPQRKNFQQHKLFAHIKGGRPDREFPVVCTSPEMLMNDEKELSKIKWEMIIIDEGHRMKNSDSKLFRILKGFTSATRLLITGTPLQNNLKELWSLLNFLLPSIFTNWDQFESWFDFSDLEDEDKTEEFLADKIKQDLVKKIHVVLQPLLLRRIKADVEHLLPKKREYVLYAPLTEEQTELYNAINNKDIDARSFLQEKVAQLMTAQNPASEIRADDSESIEDIPLALRKLRVDESKTTKPKNAFDQMMKRKTSSAPSSTSGPKRKAQERSSPSLKSMRSSRQSTPGSVRGGRRRGRKLYTEADASEEDDLDDDEFERKLATEMAAKNAKESSSEEDEEDIARVKTLQLAKKAIGNKKFGSTLMQLRLVCNSPHNFYFPWSAESGVDESLVTASGKMLLLDRLLPALFTRGHKVLIFSQFTTQLNLIEDYARELRHWNVCRIDGSVAQDDRRQQIKDFNEKPDFKLFLLSTRAGGQGINLASADTVILFDSDFNPQQDLQAQDRAHRIGQTRPVVIFRFATKGTVEEELLLNADAKRRLEKLVIKKGGFKNMGQKMDKSEETSKEALKALLLRDGEVYRYSGDDKILSDKDLDILCDRSDAAYARAATGLGNASGYKVVETKVGGIMDSIENK